MRKYLITVLLLNILIVLTACEEKNYAPVANGISYPLGSAANIHRVQHGETLYAIAWHYDLDYRKIAAINHLSPPYKLLVGQKLLLNAPLGFHHQKHQSHLLVKRTTTPIIKRRSHAPLKRAQVTAFTRWIWPTKGGKLLGNYAPQNGYKGINISGTKGQAIYAAGTGHVAYSGNGLRGYGNLIIIKHNDEFLSAYAHNNRNLVKEGQMVTAGQVIAEMGNTESRTTMLHFEIRKAGKSVNPLSYLRK